MGDDNIKLTKITFNDGRCAIVGRLEEQTSHGLVVLKNPNFERSWNYGEEINLTMYTPFKQPSKCENSNILQMTIESNKGRYSVSWDR